MFFFIGGIQPKTILVDKQARSCSACGHFEVYLKRVDHYLSLFLIPLFPVKKGTPFLICENCKTVLDGQGYRLDAEQALAEKRCLHCGRHIDPDFTFCPSCGKAL
ncbi:MAG: zinc ribbon domain-containing protein [Desulfobacterales bacterium]|nr:zinc ribbon domain-containing protein [Desulfobacterales bacterium]